MRLISSDLMIDIPYKLYDVCIVEENVEYEIQAFFTGGNNDYDCITLGTYDTVERAQDVMQDMWNDFEAGIKVFKFPPH